MSWRTYRKLDMAEMRPYEPGEDLSGIYVPVGTVPAMGGMIARHPGNHQDLWYVDEDYFKDHFEPIE
jgi:hypothetical protein